jgi:hypothetical protein
LEADFTIAGTTKEALSSRYAEAMTTVAGMLSGRDPGLLGDDPAVQRCVTEPVPMVSAAMSPTACRRSAANGVGLLFDSLTAISRCRELADIYRAAGGTGPIVLIRRAAPGGAPSERHSDQLRFYKSYAASAAIEHWSDNSPASGDAASIAELLAAQADAVGANCLNIRVHTPGLPPKEARDHITALADVVSLLRRDWVPA